MPEALQDRLEKLITLKNIPIFENLNLNNLIQVSEISQYVRHETGAEIIREGDRSDTFYIIVDGEARVYKGSHTLAVLGDGSIIGEMGVIDNSPRTASVRTEKPTLLLEIQGDAFVELLNKNGTIAFSVMKTISERLRNTLKLLESVP